MITLREFRGIGRERWRVLRNPLLRVFTGLFGTIDIHERIRAAHVIRIIEELDLPVDARILDAGSGHGLLLFALSKKYPSYQLRGIELDDSLVNECNQIARGMGLACVAFKQGDLSAVEEVDGFYDLIVSIDVLEHILDDERVLRTLREGVKESGRLVLHLPLRHQLQQRIFGVFRRHTVNDHVRDEYLSEEIRTKLDRSGFQLQELRYSFGWSGELAFELNALGWQRRVIRAFMALITFPLALHLAYRDVKAPPIRGNSMIVLAAPAYAEPLTTEAATKLNENKMPPTLQTVKKPWQK